MSERIYRDPVHNIIRLPDNSEGELMMRLIDAREFQRLRRIKQLGLGLYTYQGAEHSRFTHSLGAFHLMTRVLDRLGEKHLINEQDHTAARAAALLHDVGHGSFSQVMEKVLGLHHEKWTVEVVLSEASVNFCTRDKPEAGPGLTLLCHLRVSLGKVASSCKSEPAAGYRTVKVRRPDAVSFVSKSVIVNFNSY